MSRWLAPLGLLVAVLAGVAGVLWHGARRGTFADVGSTYRAAPDGARGLYLLAESAGLPVSRRHVDYSVMEHEGTVVLLDIGGGRRCLLEKESGRVIEVEEMIAGLGLGFFQRQLTEEECGTLLRWVEGGGSLLHVASRHDALLETLGVRLRRDDEEAADEPPPVDASAQEAAAEDQLLDSPVDADERAPPQWTREDDQEPEPDEAREAAAALSFAGRSEEEVGPPVELVPGQPTPLVHGVERAFAPVRGHLETNALGAVHVLVERAPREGAEASRTVAAAIPYGAGWVVAVAAPDLASNEWLGEADNAALWLSVLRDLTREGRIVFDEFHHGNRGRRSITGYALDRGLLPVMLQGLLVLGIGILAGRRLGRPLPIPTETLRSGGDYLDAMSHLYRLGGHTAHAADAITERALDVAQVHAGRPEVDLAARALVAARKRLQPDAGGEGATPRALMEVARRAAAVYHAVAARRRERSGRRSDSTTVRRKRAG